ncbi:GTPase family protein [Desulfonatronum lacustre]|uniref:GTPase family protein n=1 Tax=Desulfonatronum lacustre TaxID=66849 RepID=UPI0006868841|nr:GTPase domain-containing protein [Desulfonatronum lacustre]
MITRTHLFRQFGGLRMLSVVLAGLPLLILPVLGLVWLWQADLRTYWLLALGFCAVLGYGLHALMARQDNRRVPLQATRPDPNWSPWQEACWEVVERMAAQTTPQDWPLDDVQKLALLGRNTLETVARQYHPETENPLLELTIPHALLIIERASRDLRMEIVQAIPFSHTLTMGMLAKVNRWKEQVRQYETLYRAGRFVLSPYSSLFYEFRRKLGNNIANYGLDNVKGWLLGEYVRKVGYYGIELYSGQLLLDMQDPTAKPTSSTKEDLANADREETSQAERGEPLRILVLGRANAGKSSLINALFGKLTAASDILPHTTTAVKAYRLYRDGEEDALIFDVPGCDTDLFPQKALEKEVLDADLLLWVTPANQADRQEDHRQLDWIRKVFAQRQNRRQPPMVAVVSHIDKLRPFQEWQPPYDLTSSSSTKAQNIASAVSTIATDLGFPPDLTIPVCLDPTRLYNVEDTLAAVLLEVQGESQRARMLRCLEARKSQEKLEILAGQFKNIGKKVFGLVR